MTHTLTQTGYVVQCDACGWRAILTSKGPFTRVKGDPSFDHLALIDTGYIEYVEQLMQRLTRIYNERRPLPEKDDNTDDLVAAGVMDGRRLSMQQLRKLYQAIATEGYGL